jgi:LPXTG-motif cell wall-anchored protein
VKCAVVTRADHTLSGDRSQDVKVPVAFVGQEPVDTDDETGGGGTDGGGGADSGATANGGGADGTGGGLASTGAQVLTIAGLAAGLLAAGWMVYRRGRSARSAAAAGPA